MPSDRSAPATDPVPEAGGAKGTADAAPDLDDPLHIEPSQEEVQAWVERERERRRAWVEGPSEADRAAWVRRERIRRLAGLGPEARASELARMGLHYGRETQLAAEGALSLLWSWSRRTFAQLARTGLEWEEEISRSPRRRRVSLDEEER
jgi:hypothetical protein